MTKNASKINWPPKFQPSQKPIHIKNQLFIPASKELIWAWLTLYCLWPTWYANSKVYCPRADTTCDDLVLGKKFYWHTFGVDLVSTVQECVPFERISWEALGLGVDAYHGWVIIPKENGCLVVTEECQLGWSAWLLHLFMPNRMHKGHQAWLKGLAKQCLTGYPPACE